MRRQPVRIAAIGLFLLIVLVSLPVAAVAASDGAGDSLCHNSLSFFCDDFFGHTLFKDVTDAADWHRFPYNVDGAANYTNLMPENVLRLELDADATDQHYSNANISTSEINNINGNFLFGENSRVEVRMRFSPNALAHGANTGTAKGSAGFLFWNYFFNEVDPINGRLGVVRDAFGFVWQDDTSTLPGFLAIGVVQGQAAFFVPQYDLDLSQFHTYTIERRPTSMTYYVDGQLVGVLPLNQPGALTLPAGQKLSVDFWFDNATYLQDLQTFETTIIFNDLVEPQYLDIDYARVDSIQ